MAKARELMEGITIGADPELFIINKDTEEFVCPDGLIPGTKEEPHPVEGGAVQQDGFAAEFNIDPCTTYEEFSTRIRDVRKQLSEMLPKNMALVAVPTATFTEEEWARASDETKLLGCSPDYNAWSLNMNPSPKIKDRLRCAGGHLHLGWTNHADQSDRDYFKACVDLVRQLDWCLGSWSVSKDSDKLRRSMYGQAGSMRFKPYGVEYRTLSNFWLGHHSSTKVVWDRLCKSLEMMADSHYPSKFASYNASLVEGINSSEVSNNIVWTNSVFSTPVRTF